MIVAIIYAVLWSRSDQKERQTVIKSEVRRAEEHARQSGIVEIGAQGLGLRVTPQTGS